MYKTNVRINSEKALWMLPIIFLIVGVIFIAVGIGVKIADDNKKEVCSQKVSATVVNLLEKENETKKSNGSRRTTTVYSPVFSYVVDGKEYVENNNSYSSPCHYYVGQQTEIFIDPDDPSRFYAPDDNTYGILTLVFSIVGGVMTVVAVILIVSFSASARRKKAANADMYSGETYNGSDDIFQ